MTGEMCPHLDIAHHQMKPTVSAVGYIQPSCWPKGTQGNLQTTQLKLWFSPHKLIGSIAEDTCTNHTEHGEVELLPT